nr:MAG TPA: hypothetical protein [Caudoviricetes sp.]
MDSLWTVWVKTIHSQLSLLYQRFQGLFFISMDSMDSFFNKIVKTKIIYIYI